MALTNLSSHYEEDNYEHVVPGLIYVETSFPSAQMERQYCASQPKGCICGLECETTCECFRRNVSMKGIVCAMEYECNDDCSCGKDCKNRIVQHGPFVGLKICHFKNKGFGVVTSKEIPAGVFVCEYAGELISESEAKERLANQKDEDANYILILREFLYHDKSYPIITAVDPTITGNIGRYINHSCDPNLVVIPVRWKSLIPHIYMFSLRMILAGEELVYNYSTVSNKKHFLGGNNLTSNENQSTISNLKDASQNISLLIGNLSPPISSFIPPFVPSVVDSPSTSKMSLKRCFCASESCIGFLPRDDF